MLEVIRYRILMHRLRSEIAQTVQSCCTPQKVSVCAHASGLKTACKACESIV